MKLSSYKINEWTPFLGFGDIGDPATYLSQASGLLSIVSQAWRSKDDEIANMNSAVVAAALDGVQTLIHLADLGLKSKDGEVAS